jgi:hypothetical protein
VSDQRPWHRLFGMSLTDFFTGQPVRVEMEVDLSRKQQMLDVVVLRTSGEPLTCRLPDGFEGLAAYNLISFKSYQETLDPWALLELIGHYVNYRKQTSPSMDDLLPEDDFRLFAVCVRSPQKLAGLADLQQLGEGVYELRVLDWPIRIIVVHQLPQEENNALLHLFAALGERIRYGEEHYRPRSRETSTFLYQLFDRYKLEGVPMPYTKEEFISEAKEAMRKDPIIIKWVKDNLSVEERLEGVPVEKLLEGVPVEKLLEAVPAEKFLEAVPAEKRVKGLSAEELLRALPPETLEALRKGRPGDKAAPE